MTLEHFSNMYKRTRTTGLLSALSLDITETIVRFKGMEYFKKKPSFSDLLKIKSRFFYPPMQLLSTTMGREYVDGKSIRNLYTDLRLCDEVEDSSENKTQKS